MIGRAATTTFKSKMITKFHVITVIGAPWKSVLRIDLGSSNGTLVNGEDFDGEYVFGEEVKAGTLFRFRMQ